MLIKFSTKVLLAPLTSSCCGRFFSVPHYNYSSKIDLSDKKYDADFMTNITPKIKSHLNKSLHIQKNHPLCHLRKRIEDFIYRRYVNNRGNALFSIHNSLQPIVTTSQNFDSLLIPESHITRQKGDNYYINKGHLLRSHTSAHQSDLIRMGLNNFLVTGDVYRRDTIDCSHYPVFHQAEGVRLLSKSDIYGGIPNISEKCLFQDSGERTSETQGIHTPEVIEVLSKDLKDCLVKLAEIIIGQDVEWRWTDAYFPFTCPSWELEVKFGNTWVEMLGCGIMEQEILNNAGVDDKVGWAFGLGLERWAMKLYEIPDIRLFWCTDERFLKQFEFSDPYTTVKFKPFSSNPPCINDISFWLPDEGDECWYSPQDFYDLVRNIGGDLVEQVTLFDDYLSPKTNKRSHSFHIVYRAMDRPLTNAEANKIHGEIGKSAAESFKVTVR